MSFKCGDVVKCYLAFANYLLYDEIIYVQLFIVIDDDYKYTLNEF